MRKVWAWLAVVSVIFCVVACDSDIGEECADEGKVDGECVDGTVCGRAKGALVCLKQCTNPGDCGAGETCGAVGFTNLRACRAD